MKVLILHQHFNTPEKGGAIRSYYLAKALVDRGIDRDRLSARGFGERRPVASNATGSGRDANRRVEIAYSGGRQIQYTG